MSNKQIIEIMEAYLDGKEIKVSLSDNGPVYTFNRYYDGRRPETWDDFKSVSISEEGLNFVPKIQKDIDKYRPYIDTDELFQDYKERFKQYNLVAPFLDIILIHKDGYRVHINPAVKDNRSIWAITWRDLKELFNDYTYLDGTPIGKKVK